jgi:cell volume regulation protein A
MFVVLGLLVYPESLLEVWWQGLLIAAVLILVARPLAVVPMLRLFRFSRNEIALVSWVGLRGSVPIILAIFPLMFGLPNADLIFNVVFFVVLISATLQGSTLPLVARRLGLTEPPPAAPAATLEITAVGDIDADIVEYTLGEHPRAAGRLLSQMALPDDTVVAMITRGTTVIPPRGSTRLQQGDHLFVVLKPETRPFVDCVFAQVAEAPRLDLPDTELRLKGSTRVEDLRHSYGIDLAVEPQLTLDQLLRRDLAEDLKDSGGLVLDNVCLQVRGMIGNRITTVGLRALPQAEDAPL